MASRRTPRMEIELDDEAVRIPARSYQLPPRRNSCPIRTAIAAVVLLTVGTVLLIFGVSLLKDGDSERGIPLATLGGLTFLPGSYSTYILFGAWRRWAGYSYDQVPSWDED